MTTIQILERTPVPWSSRDQIKEIVEAYFRTAEPVRDNACWIGAMCYLYGVMQGKRQERARRRRGCKDRRKQL